MNPGCLALKPLLSPHTPQIQQGYSRPLPGSANFSEKENQAATSESLKGLSLPIVTFCALFWAPWVPTVITVKASPSVTAALPRASFQECFSADANE